MSSSGDTEFWNLIQRILQFVCCTSSLVLNGTLILLIFTKSPKHIGFYKYLMAYICVFEFLYSIWDIIVEPRVHSYQAAFVVFRSDNDFDQDKDFLLIITYCGCFGFSLAVFGVHFIYRYGAVNKEFGDRYLSGFKVSILFIIPLFYGAWWTLVCLLFYRSDVYCDNYMERTVMEEYGVDVRNTSYLCVTFHRMNEFGVEVPDMNYIGPMFFCFFMIGSSIICVFYFGYQCYAVISKSIKTSNAISKTTKHLQRQLFNALVAQTIIPLILMYIPIGILVIFPMINYKLFFKTNFVASTIAAYPAIDPLPNMIIIKCYRRAILDFLAKIFGNQKLKYLAKVGTSVARSLEQRISKTDS